MSRTGHARHRGRVYARRRHDARRRIRRLGFRGRGGYMAGQMAQEDPWMAQEDPWAVRRHEASLPPAPPRPVFDSAPDELWEF